MEVWFVTFLVLNWVKVFFPQTTIYFVNFVSHLLFGKLWTGVNLYSSCILIVAKLYRFLYFGWEIFLLSIINCFLSWHFNQSLVMITEAQLKSIFLRGLRFVSCVNVTCTLVMQKDTLGEERGQWCVQWGVRRNRNTVFNFFLNSS